MEEQKKLLPKPDWKLYYSVLFFTRGAKDYKKDRERYDKQFLTDSGLIAYDTDKGIALTSALLLTIIVSLWTLLPQLIELPNWLLFIKLGMTNVSWKENYGNATFMLIIPSSISYVYQKIPKIIPNAKIRLLTNIIIKIIPVILLTLFIWFIVRIKKYFKARTLEKNSFKNTYLEDKTTKMINKNKLLVIKNEKKAIKEARKLHIHEMAKKILHSKK